MTGATSLVVTSVARKLSQAGEVSGLPLGTSMNTTARVGPSDLAESVRGVNSTGRLEERASHWQEFLRLVIDGKTHLPFHDVRQGRARMPVPRA